MCVSCGHVSQSWILSQDHTALCHPQKEEDSDSSHDGNCMFNGTTAVAQKTFLEPLLGGVQEFIPESKTNTVHGVSMKQITVSCAVWLSVQISLELPHSLSSGERRAAQITACCSKNCSIISNALFHTCYVCFSCSRFWHLFPEDRGGESQVT